MTSGGSADPGQSNPANSPGDIPAARPAALTSLGALVGEWQLQSSFRAGYFAAGRSPVTGGGRTRFEWLDGAFFLLQRFTGDNRVAAPSGIAIIGAGTIPGTFTQHYYDSRGVARVYQMTLIDGVWKLWREAPRFWQRYTGVFSDNGSKIEGAWEGSVDGSEWKHDFDLSYTKIT